MTLADLLEAKRLEIIERWAARMAGRVTPHKLSWEQLVGRLPAFFEELVATLRRGERLPLGADLPFPSSVSEEHARQRLDLGFDVTLLVRECGLLRDCILQVLEEEGFPLRASDVRLLSRGLDEGAVQAITHFVLGQERGEAGQGFSEATPEGAQRAEAALRESEERFRLLVDSVKDYSVFMVSVDGRVSGWNPGAERLKGYKAEEIIGEHISRFFPREEVEERIPERLIERATAEGLSGYEGWLVRKDGSCFWGSISLNAVRDEQGRLRGFSNVARDSTERRRAELSQQFISESSQFLAGVLDYETTLQELARLATRGMADWCALFVLSPKERSVYVAHSQPELEPLLRRAVRRVPSDASLPHGVVHVARTGASELYNSTHEVAWARGALGVESPELFLLLRVRSYMCVPLKARGEIFGVMALVASAPGRRFGPADLTMAEEFARRGALAVENAHFFRQAQEAVRTRDEFISMASHDLRTPLASLRLQLQKTLRRARGVKGQPLQAEEVALWLEQMDGQVTRLVQMMDTLLDVTRITAGRLELKVEPMDLAEVVRETVAHFAEELARVGCEVHLEAVAPVLGRWDRLRLEQVMTNLFSNALKYGKGRPIEVKVEADGPLARLSIQDHGVGIASEDQERLFQRFERIQPEQGVAGFGVGLWIVHRIVEAHGGLIRVESQRGEGATFRLELPRGETPVERAAPQPTGRLGAPAGLDS